MGFTKTPPSVCRKSLLASVEYLAVYTRGMTSGAECGGVTDLAICSRTSCSLPMTRYKRHRMTKYPAPIVACSALIHIVTSPAYLRLSTALARMAGCPVAWMRHRDLVAVGAELSGMTKRAVVSPLLRCFTMSSRPIAPVMRRRDAPLVTGDAVVPGMTSIAVTSSDLRAVNIQPTSWMRHLQCMAVQAERLRMTLITVHFPTQCHLIVST